MIRALGWSVTVSAFWGTKGGLEVKRYKTNKGDKVFVVQVGIIYVKGWRKIK